MAAKLRPRKMLPRPVSSTAAARLKPGAVSFSGLSDGNRCEGYGLSSIWTNDTGASTIRVM